MLKEHNKFPLFDAHNRREMTLEVNWNDRDDVKDCNVVRLKWGKNKTQQAVIKTDDLYLIMLSLLPQDRKFKMLSPFVRQTDVKYRLHEVVLKADRDISKGEEIRASVQVPIQIYKV